MLKLMYFLIYYMKFQFLFYEICEIFILLNISIYIVVPIPQFLQNFRPYPYSCNIEYDKWVMELLMKICEKLVIFFLDCMWLCGVGRIKSKSLFFFIFLMKGKSFSHPF